MGKKWTRIVSACITIRCEEEIRDILPGSQDGKEKMISSFYPSYCYTYWASQQVQDTNSERSFSLILSDQRRSQARPVVLHPYRNSMMPLVGESLSAVGGPWCRYH